MLKLVQTFGAHAGRTREFDQDVVRVGRLPTCEFAFDPHADLDASGLHAEIRRENGQYVVIDAGSRNGTLVGGRTIQRHTLSDGDEIEFGTGGPRVRVSIAGGRTPSRPANATAPPTPIDLGPSAGIAPDGPTAYAPAASRPPSVRPMSFAPRAASPLGIPPPTAIPPAPAPAIDPTEIARIVEERTRPLVYAVGIMGLLLILSMCGLTGVALYLVTHS